MSLSKLTYGSSLVDGDVVRPVLKPWDVVVDVVDVDGDRKVSHRVLARCNRLLNLRFIFRNVMLSTYPVPSSASKPKLN